MVARGHFLNDDESIDLDTAPFGLFELDDLMGDLTLDPLSA